MAIIKSFEEMKSWYKSREALRQTGLLIYTEVVNKTIDLLHK